MGDQAVNDHRVQRGEGGVVLVDAVGRTVQLHERQRGQPEVLARALIPGPEVPSGVVLGQLVDATAHLGGDEDLGMALAQLGATLATVGPGQVASVVHQGGYTLKALVSPNTPAAPNSFGLEVTNNGRPVTGAAVTLTFEMLDMQIGNEE